MNRMRIISLLIAAVTPFTFVNCGSSEDDTPTLHRIEIKSSNGNRLDLFAEEKTQLSILGFDQFGDPFSIASAIIWTSNNGNIQVSPNGSVTPLLVGSSTITADVDGVNNNYDVSIWDSSAPRTEIFISNVENLHLPPWQILRYYEDGSYSEVFTDENLGWPQEIVVLESQNIVLISNVSTNNITKYDLKTGEYKGIFAAGINGPTRMKIGNDNLLYVLQWRGDGLVKRYQLDGTFVDNFTTVGVNRSIGFDWDSQGNLYVSSFNDATVRKFDPSGNDLGIFVNSNLSGPTDIWFDDNGDLLVNDWRGGVVSRFNSSGAFLGVIITGLTEPEGVSYFENGDFLIGNGGVGSGSIKRYGPNWNFIKDQIPHGFKGLKRPNAITIRKVN